MTETAPCPICGSATREAGRKKGGRIDRQFSLRRCASCGFAFVADPATDYAAIYDVAYYEGRGADPLVDYAFEFEHPYETIRHYEWRGILAAVTALQPGPKRWLDFGSGSGGLVRFLTHRDDIAAYGYDTGAWADRGRTAGLAILTDAELATRGGSFDVITAIEVLEHIVDPVAVLKQLRRLLRPGGMLFLTTGNLDAAPANLQDWRYVTPDIHVSFFTPGSLAIALRAAGFEPVYRGRTAGWTDIIRFKVLKNLGVRRRIWWEKLFPWPAIARIVDRKFRVTAHPVGRAV